MHDLCNRGQVPSVARAIPGAAVHQVRCPCPRSQIAATGVRSRPLRRPSRSRVGPVSCWLAHGTRRGAKPAEPPTNRGGVDVELARDLAQRVAVAASSKKTVPVRRDRQQRRERRPWRAQVAARDSGPRLELAECRPYEGVVPDSEGMTRGRLARFSLHLLAVASAGGFVRGCEEGEESRRVQEPGWRRTEPLAHCRAMADIVYASLRVGSRGRVGAHARIKA